MKTMKTYTSCMRAHVRYYLYEPKVILRVKGVILIHHGFCEHADRYDHFASFLSNRGFVVVVSDFVGHGKSLADFEQGYFGKSNGCEKLVCDMHHLVTIIKKTYTDVPYFMLGVGLGSLLIRKYITQYGDYLEGVVLLGTPSYIRHKFIKKNYLRIMKKIKGPMYKSQNYFNMTQRMYNKKIGLHGNDAEWLTTDKNERHKYLKDPMTHFVYTAQGYYDIFNLIEEVSGQESILRIPQYLSVYIGVGEFDPIAMDKGWLAKQYKNKGIRDVTYHVFEKCRHFLLFEKEKKDIYFNIIDWLNERTYL